MSSPDPQVILKLAADIVAAKEHLGRLQVQWDSFFSPNAIGIRATLESFPQKPAPQKTVARGDSLSGRIIALLDKEPMIHYEAHEIAQELGEPQDKVQRTINKLVFKKRIGRYSRGLYESIIQV